MIISISQNSFLKFIGIILFVAYYIFLQQDLISTTEVLPVQCIQDKKLEKSLCVSCIKSQDYHIAEESSVYINNNANEFKVMTIKKSYELECDDIIQFVSYQEPIMKTEEIKFEELKATNEIFKDLGVEVYPIGDKFEIEFAMQIIAVFQIIDENSKETPLMTYSTTKSVEALEIYASSLSAFSIIVQIVILLHSFYSKKFRFTILVMIVSSLMVLASSILDHFSFLIRYSTILVFGLYFVYASMEQKYTVVSVSLLGLVQILFQQFYSEGLVLVLLILVLRGRGQEFDRLSNIIGVCMFLLAICAVFEQHSHVLSFPLRRIIEYTALCLSPILVDIISITGADREYEEVDNEPVSSGISLPGYEDQEPIEK